MHVLVAENDPSTRRVIAALLNDAGGIEVVQTQDGQEALVRLKQTPFDLLLLDGDLPGKAGIEIVRELRDWGSRTPVIMVTAVADRQRVLEALSAGVSEYVIKPFDPGYLAGKVEKFRQGRPPAPAPAHAARATPPPAAGRPETQPSAPPAGDRTEGGRAPEPGNEKPDLETVLGQIDDVSTIPEMAVRFLEVANNPDVTIDELKDLLASDPALAVRVLRVVNSSAFSVQQKITNLEQAIAYLGVKYLRGLAVAISVSQLFRVRGSLRTYSRAGLCQHMVAVGVCARLLAKRLTLPDWEDYFLAGLLHDIGIVLEDQYVHQQFCRIVRSLDTERTLIQCERDYLGFDHTMLGDRMGERWKLPDNVRAAIRHHHGSADYDGEHKPIVRCVELANVICSAEGNSSVGMNLLKSVSPTDLGIPLREEDLPPLVEALHEELAKSASLFRA